MNLYILVWNYLKARPLTTVLNIVLLALGISVITVLLLFTSQLREKITADAKGIDLVVGAKGSPLQLILCSIFHVDFPTGNIKMAEAEKISRHRLVKKAIPLALGDSYQGYRIVGTNRDYPELYHARLAAGNWWSMNLEVTVGATVAGNLGLKQGSTFVSAHGLTSNGHAHNENRYVVSGILSKSNSIIDNLIFTNIESVWLMHGTLDEDESVPAHPSPLVPSVEAGDTLLEVTSLLIQYRNPLAVIQLPRHINSNSNLQAASPAFETARLFSILGVGVDVIRGFALVLILISGLSIFLALYNALKERQYDLAIMRSMGASRSKLLLSMIMEGSMLTVFGSLAGLTLGHGVLFIFTVLVKESAASGMDAFVFHPMEGALFGGCVLLGVVCSLLPAIAAYRTNIHNVLAGN